MTSLHVGHQSSFTASVSVNDHCSIILPQLIKAPSPLDLSSLSTDHPHEGTTGAVSLISSLTAQSPSSSSSSRSQTPSASLTEDEHIPRPRNRFILFRQHYCKIYHSKESRKAPSNGPRNSNVSQAATAVWKSMTEEDKEYWQQLAIEEKQNHREMYPDYKFRPQVGGRKDRSRRKARVTPENLREEIGEILCRDAESESCADGGITASSRNPVDSETLSSTVLAPLLIPRLTIGDGYNFSVDSVESAPSPLWFSDTNASTPDHTFSSDLYDPLSSQVSLAVPPQVTDIITAPSNLAVEGFTMAAPELDPALETLSWDSFLLAFHPPDIPHSSALFSAFESPNSPATASSISSTPFETLPATPTGIHPTDHPLGASESCNADPFDDSDVPEITVEFVPSPTRDSTPITSRKRSYDSMASSDTVTPESIHFRHSSLERSRKLRRGSDDMPIPSISSVSKRHCAHTRAISLPDSAISKRWC